MSDFRWCFGKSSVLQQACSSMVCWLWSRFWCVNVLPRTSACQFSHISHVCVQVGAVCMWTVYWAVVLLYVVPVSALQGLLQVGLVD
jgi:hypothetical protein